MGFLLRLAILNCKAQQLVRSLQYLALASLDNISIYIVLLDTKNILDLQPKMATPITLAGSDAIHIATVLEDCIDQLSVLGKIMPSSYDGRPEAYSVRTL